MRLKNQTIESAKDVNTHKPEYSSAIKKDNALVSNNSNVAFPRVGSESQDDCILDEKATGKKGLTATPLKFIQDENRQTGHINHEVYLEYLSSVGGPQFWTFCILSFSGQQLLTLLRSWVLKEWTTASQESFSSSMEKQCNLTDSAYSMTSTTSETSRHFKYYVIVYVALSLISGITGTLPFLLLYTGSVRASRSLFRRSIRNILRMPLHWIDTTPQGRVLNRFTGDFVTMDFVLPKDLGYLATAYFQVLTVVISGYVRSKEVST